MFDLFTTFLKINCLTTSGPASIGLTKELVVPSIVPESEFSRMIAISSGIPGSDAIQMAWQVGYYHNGFLGALVALLGALIPCVVLVALVAAGASMINQGILTRFFNGVNPALCLMLLVTAYGLYSPLNGGGPSVVFAVAAMLMLYHTPMPLVLVTCGLIGVLIL